MAFKYLRIISDIAPSSGWPFAGVRLALLLMISKTACGLGIAKVVNNGVQQTAAQKRSPCSPDVVQTVVPSTDMMAHLQENAACHFPL